MSRGTSYREESEEGEGELPRVRRAHGEGAPRGAPHLEGRGPQLRPDPSTGAPGDQES